jgi:hypothetical protein
MNVEGKPIRPIGPVLTSDFIIPCSIFDIPCRFSPAIRTTSGVQPLTVPHRPVVDRSRCRCYDGKTVCGHRFPQAVSLLPQHDGPAPCPPRHPHNRSFRWPAGRVGFVSRSTPVLPASARPAPTPNAAPASAFRNRRSVRLAATRSLRRGARRRIHPRDFLKSLGCGGTRGANAQSF